MDFKKVINEYDCILLDLDGVIYSNGNIINGVAETILYLQNRNIDVYICSNSFRRTPESIQNNLFKNKINISKKSIFTTSRILRALIQEEHYNEIMAFGCKEAENYFQSCGVNFNTRLSDRTDLILVGAIENETFNYKNINDAINAIRKGCNIIATSSDLIVPYQKIDMGSGILSEYFKKVSCIYNEDNNYRQIGKPSMIYFNYIKNAINYSNKKTLMVGDTIESDIEGGIDAQLDTMLVLSGNSNVKSIGDYKPNYVFTDFSIGAKYV